MPPVEVDVLHELADLLVEPSRTGATGYAATTPSHSDRLVDPCRDASDVVDSLRMNLRQSRRALTVRDEEVRRLRATVTHLESTLAQRERELRDTVHRLQRVAAAKQDHIDHLNRQASLGFLREAQEQADEYQREVRRLSRILAEGTSGAGQAARGSTHLTSDGLPATAPGLRSLVRGYGELETCSRIKEARTPTAADCPPVPKEGPQVGRPPSSHAGILGLSLTKNSAQESYLESSVRSKGDTWPSAVRNDGGYHGLEPSLAWDSATEAVSASRGPVAGPRMIKWRQIPHQPVDPRPLDAARDQGNGTIAMSSSAVAANTVYSSPRFTRRVGSPKKSTGRDFARSGCRWSLGRFHSPPRSAEYAEDTRTSSMAASARLRADVRESIAERSEALAVQEESDRLRAARIKRSRRTRIARKAIARYRAERILDLDTRLARRFGPTPHDDNPSVEADGEGQSRSDDGHQIPREGADIRNFKSTQTRVINAAIEAAAAGVTSDGGIINGQPAERDEHELAQQARTRASSQQTCTGGPPDKGASVASCGSISVWDDEHAHREEGTSCRARPLGRPPLVPFRANRRKKTTRTSHSFVDGVGGGWGSCERGGAKEQYSWEYEDSDADEVQTDAASDGSGIAEGLWGDDEDDDVLWEGSIPSTGWGEEGSVSDNVVAAPACERMFRSDADHMRGDDHGRKRNWEGSGHSRYREKGEAVDHRRREDGVCNSEERNMRESIVPPDEMRVRQQQPRTHSRGVSAATVEFPTVNPTLSGGAAVGTYSGGDMKASVSTLSPGPHANAGGAVNLRSTNREADEQTSPLTVKPGNSVYQAKRKASDSSLNGDSLTARIPKEADNDARRELSEWSSSVSWSRESELLHTGEIREEGQVFANKAHRVNTKDWNVKEESVPEKNIAFDSEHGGRWSITERGDGDQATGDSAPVHEKILCGDDRYNSRSTLLVMEDEQYYGRDGRYREEALPIEMTTPVSRERSTPVSVFPDYQDDFFEESEKHVHGGDAPFAVSSPSGHEAKDYERASTTAISAYHSSDEAPISRPVSISENATNDGWQKNDRASGSSPGVRSSEPSGRKRPRQPRLPDGIPTSISVSPPVPRFASREGKVRLDANTSAADKTRSGTEIKPQATEELLASASEVGRDTATAPVKTTHGQSYLSQTVEKDTHSCDKAILGGIDDGRRQSPFGDDELDAAGVRPSRGGSDDKHAAAGQLLDPSLATAGPAKDDFSALQLAPGQDNHSGSPAGEKELALLDAAQSALYHGTDHIGSAPGEKQTKHSTKSRESGMIGDDMSPTALDLATSFRTIPRGTSATTGIAVDAADQGLVATSENKGSAVETSIVYHDSGKGVEPTLSSPITLTGSNTGSPVIGRSPASTTARVGEPLANDRSGGTADEASSPTLLLLPMSSDIKTGTGSLAPGKSVAVISEERKQPQPEKAISTVTGRVLGSTPLIPPKSMNSGVEAITDGVVVADDHEVNAEWPSPEQKHESSSRGSLEEGELIGEGLSSRSGSVLDVGGAGGIDTIDDDDGYF